MREYSHPEEIKESREQEIWRIMDEAVQSAYLKEAEENGYDPEIVYYSPRCEGVSSKAVENLLAAGIPSKLIKYEGWDITNHDFALVDVEGEQWVVDATWQQFLEKADEQLPKILKAKTEEIDTLVEKLGVPEKWRHMWHTAIKRAQEAEEK